MWTYVAVCVGIAIVCTVVICVGIHNMKAQDRRSGSLRARGTLTLEEWYGRHFEPLGVSEEVSCSVCEALAKAIRCDFTNLRPSDSFDRELASHQFDVLGFDPDEDMERFQDQYLVKIIGERASRELNENATSIKTVGQLVAWCDAMRNGKSQERKE